MPATIRRLRTRADFERAEKALQLRELARELDMPLPVQRAISREVARHTTPRNSRWVFVMISAEQNAAVVDWLYKYSQYPTLAPRIWAKLFVGLDYDTGQIAYTRDELAAALGAPPEQIGRVMGELRRIGAVTQKRERVAGVRGPGRAIWFMSPIVGTHLPEGPREEAQAAASPLRLVRPE